MNTAFIKINYDMQIVNLISRVLKLMSDWTTLSSKYNLESQIVDKKGKKVWRETIIVKLKPDALKRDILGTLALIDEPRVQELKDDNVKFYEFVVERATEYVRMPRLRMDP